jgi:hypothetical protein
MIVARSGVVLSKTTRPRTRLLRRADNSLGGLHLREAPPPDQPVRRTDWGQSTRTVLSSLIDAKARAVACNQQTILKGAW